MYKMADEVGDQTENALNLIVSTTEQSGNMKKGLKQTIYETISTLRDLFVKIRASRDSKTTEIDKLAKQVTIMKAELEQCNGKYAKEHRTPSTIYGTEPGDRMAREHGTPYLIPCLEPAWIMRGMALPK
jgi:hypothetical protein